MSKISVIFKLLYKTEIKKSINFTETSSVTDEITPEGKTGEGKRLSGEGVSLHVSENFKVANSRINCIRQVLLQYFLTSKEKLWIFFGDTSCPLLINWDVNLITFFYSEILTKNCVLWSLVLCEMSIRK